MAGTLDVDGLQQLLWGFAPHRIITVAARTGILERLSRTAASPDEVAAELGLDPLATAKVVRALTALGLLEAEGHHYRVVPALSALLAGGSDSLLPFLEHSHHLYERWGESLEPWLRGEQWATAERSTAEIRQFGEAMRAMGSLLARRVAAALDLGGVHRLLDVGGGFGHFAQAICASAPAVRATVLDTEQVVTLAREDMQDRPEADRISFVAGDYLESDYGGDFDLVLFANVLHQELPEAAARMIHRGAAALAPGGRVAVVDFAIDPEQRRHLMGTLFAINMRSFGDTHTEASIRGWMTAAGLLELTRHDLGEQRWIITGALP